MQDIWQFLTAKGMIASYIIVIVVIVFLVAMRKAYQKRQAAASAKATDEGKRARFETMAYTTIKYIVLVVAFILILEVNGVNISALVTGLGIASAAVALAVQDALKDLIMRAHMATDQFFTLGNIVQYKDITGEVITITPQTTKIRSIDDFSVTAISNRNIDEITVLSNFNALSVRLDYGLNRLEISKLFEDEICPKIKEIKHVSKCQFKGISKLAESGVEYRIYFYVSPLYRSDVVYAINAIIYDTLQANNIQVVYDQITVHTVAEGSLPEPKLEPETE